MEEINVNAPKNKVITGAQTVDEIETYKFTTTLITWLLNNFVVMVSKAYNGAVKEGNIQ